MRMSKHHQHSEDAVLQQLLHNRKIIPFPDQACRLYAQSQMRFEGGILVLPFIHGCTILSGEVHRKLIELGPWDNRGIPLSVSIKCLGELSGVRGGGVDWLCLVPGQMLPTGEWGVGNNQHSGLKGAYKQSISLDPEPHLITS